MLSPLLELRKFRVVCTFIKELLGLKFISAGHLIHHLDLILVNFAHFPQLKWFILGFNHVHILIVHVIPCITNIFFIFLRKHLVCISVSIFYNVFIIVLNRQTTLGLSKGSYICWRIFTVKGHLAVLRWHLVVINIFC